MSNKLLGRNRDGSLLLLPAVYSDPTWQKSLAQGTLHCQGPGAYKAATLSPVFWNLAISSCPSLYSGIAGYAAATLHGVDVGDTFDLPWYVHFPDDTHDWTWPNHLWEGAPEPGSTGIGSAWYENYNPNRPPPNRGSPAPTNSGVPYTTLYFGSVQYYVGWPQWTVAVTNAYIPDVGGFGPAIDIPKVQIVVSLKVDWNSQALPTEGPNFNYGRWIWGAVYDSLWPDVMRLDALTLPYHAPWPAGTGLDDPDLYADLDHTDWSGTSITLTRIPKPGDPYVGRPSVG